MYQDKVYILKRGIYEEVYGNISLLCREESLDYYKVYRGIRSKKCYSEDGLLVIEKKVKRSKRNG